MGGQVLEAVGALKAVGAAATSSAPTAAEDLAGMAAERLPRVSATRAPTALDVSASPGALKTTNDTMSVVGKVLLAAQLGSPLLALGVDKLVKSQPGYGAPERAGFTAPTSSDLARQTAYANAEQLTEDQAAADRQARRQALAQGDPSQAARDEYIRQASQAAADAARARSAASRANPPVLG